jgi:hypothetical protein
MDKFNNDIILLCIRNKNNVCYELEEEKIEISEFGEYNENNDIPPPPPTTSLEEEYFPFEKIKKKYDFFCNEKEKNLYSMIKSGLTYNNQIQKLGKKIYQGLYFNYQKFYFIENFKKNGKYIEMYNEVDYYNNFKKYFDYGNIYDGIYKENFGSNNRMKRMLL